MALESPNEGTSQDMAACDQEPLRPGDLAVIDQLNLGVDIFSHGAFLFGLSKSVHARTTCLTLRVRADYHRWPGEMDRQCRTRHQV